MHLLSPAGRMRLVKYQSQTAPKKCYHYHYYYHHDHQYTNDLQSRSRGAVATARNPWRATICLWIPSLDGHGRSPLRTLRSLGFLASEGIGAEVAVWSSSEGVAVAGPGCGHLPHCNPHCSRGPCDERAGHRRLQQSATCDCDQPQLEPDDHKLA